MSSWATKKTCWAILSGVDATGATATRRGSQRTSAVIGSVTEQTTTPETLAGLKALEDAAGMALWLDTDMDTASANVILAAGQGLLSDEETPEAVMEKVRAAAKETLAQR